MEWRLGNSGTRGKLLFICDRDAKLINFTEKLESYYSRKDGSVAFDAAVFSSVVPAANSAIASALGRVSRQILAFPGDIDGGLRVKPKPADRVGADRLANALGAIAATRARRDFSKFTHALVVDAGTAVTVDAVSLGGVFEGGMIAPGPRLGARALADYTAQLPLVEFVKTRRATGRNTTEAIESGIWFGFRGLVRECVCALRREFPKSIVYVAGGDGRACLEGSDFPWAEDAALTHRGLATAFVLFESGARQRGTRL